MPSRARRCAAPSPSGGRLRGLGRRRTRCAPSGCGGSTVPVLAPGQRPLRVLHVSDLHLVPTQRRKIEWVRALAGLEPDLVVDTGDNLAHLDAVPAVLDALGPLLERPGAFVMGSNDYYAPMLKNPVALPAARYARSGWASGRLPYRGPARRVRSPPGGWTWTTPGPGSRSTTARSSWSAPTTRTSGRPVRRGGRPGRPRGRPVARGHPRAVPAGPRPDGGRRARPGARRPHPRRAALRAAAAARW